jgi:acylphosphatase
VNVAERRADPAAGSTLDIVTQRLSIRGRVQGVGYRDAMRHEARRLGVAGWVRNRHDGSVEAVVQGPPEAVDALMQWVHRGPPLAMVLRVEVSPADGSFAQFDRAPTV